MQSIRHNPFAKSLRSISVASRSKKKPKRRKRDSLKKEGKKPKSPHYKKKATIKLQNSSNFRESQAMNSSVKKNRGVRLDSFSDKKMLKSLNSIVTGQSFYQDRPRLQQKGLQSKSRTLQKTDIGFNKKRENRPKNGKKLSIMEAKPKKLAGDVKKGAKEIKEVESNNSNFTKAALKSRLMGRGLRGRGGKTRQAGRRQRTKQELSPSHFAQTSNKSQNYSKTFKNVTISQFEDSKDPSPKMIPKESQKTTNRFRKTSQSRLTPARYAWCSKSPHRSKKAKIGKNLKPKAPSTLSPLKTSNRSSIHTNAISQYIQLSRQNTRKRKSSYESYKRTQTSYYQTSMLEETMQLKTNQFKQTKLKTSKVFKKKDTLEAMLRPTENILKIENRLTNPNLTNLSFKSQLGASRGSFGALGVDSMNTTHHQNLINEACSSFVSKLSAIEREDNQRQAVQLRIKKRDYHNSLLDKINMFSRFKYKSLDQVFNQQLNDEEYRERDLLRETTQAYSRMVVSQIERPRVFVKRVSHDVEVQRGKYFYFCFKSDGEMMPLVLSFSVLEHERRELSFRVYFSCLNSTPGQKDCDDYWDSPKKIEIFEKTLANKKKMLKYLKAARGGAYQSVSRIKTGQNLCNTKSQSLPQKSKTRRKRKRLTVLELTGVKKRSKKSIKVKNSHNSSFEDTSEDLDSESNKQSQEDILDIPEEFKEADAGPKMPAIDFSDLRAFDDEDMGKIDPEVQLLQKSVIGMRLKRKRQRSKHSKSLYKGKWTKSRIGSVYQAEYNKKEGIGSNLRSLGEKAARKRLRKAKFHNYDVLYFSLFSPNKMTVKIKGDFFGEHMIEDDERNFYAPKMMDYHVFLKQNNLTKQQINSELRKLNRNRKKLKYFVKDSDNKQLLSNHQELEKRPFLQGLLDINSAIKKVQNRKDFFLRQKKEMTQYKIERHKLMRQIRFYILNLLKERIFIKDVSYSLITIIALFLSLDAIKKHHNAVLEFKKKQVDTLYSSLYCVLGWKKVMFKRKADGFEQRVQIDSVMACGLLSVAFRKKARIEAKRVVLRGLEILYPKKRLLELILKTHQILTSIIYNWKETIVAKHRYKDSLREKWEDNFEIIYSIVQREFELVHQKWKKLEFGQIREMKKAFVKRYYGMRRVIYSLDLDEYRLCKQMYPSSVSKIGEVNIHSVRKELKVKYKDSHDLSVAKFLGGKETVREIMAEQDLGTDIRSYDLANRYYIYTIYGVRRPKLHLPVNDDHLKYSMQKIIERHMNKM